MLAERPPHEDEPSELPTLGEYLKARRKALGIKPAEIARRAGISPAYISNLERDVIANPRMTSIVRLLDAYEIDMNLLLAEVYGAEIDDIEDEKALVIGRLLLQLPEAQQDETLQWIRYQLENPR